MTMHLKQCPACSELSDLHAQRCVNCGHVFRTRFSPPDQTRMVPPYQPAPDYRRDYVQLPPGVHSVWVALVLSLLCLAGSGQVYNRQPVKAVVLLLFSLMFAILTGGISVFITFPFCIVDAVMVATRLNRGEPVREWQFF